MHRDAGGWRHGGGISPLTFQKRATGAKVHFLNSIIDVTRKAEVYLGSISNNIRQEISSFIRHKAVVNVKLRCFESTRKLQSWFSVKDRQALLNRFNVVYKLTCSCGASYIGQTQRN